MRICFFISAFICAVSIVRAQITQFPYKEKFDTVSPPALPYGWTTSTNKNPSGDFSVSPSSPRAGSAPHCLSATDARVQQFVVSPIFSFQDKIVDSLEFFERRTGSFTAGVIVEAILNDDSLSALRLTDTLMLSSSNNGMYQRRIIPLPDTLNGQHNVRFRWRIAGNPAGGGTAVLRIDDITITTRKTKDLALSSLMITPPLPRDDENLSVTVCIRNSSLGGNFSGEIHLYDSLTLVTVHNFSHTFSVNESLTVTLLYPHISAGRHPLTARLLVGEDEDTTNNVLSFFFSVGVKQRTVVINEIMYAPPSGTPEWVELMNNSTEPISLSGWRISDAGSTKAAISGTMPMLLPSCFAIVTTDTNAFKTVFETEIPLFQASFSALNNSGDAVILFDRSGYIVDTVSYLSSWGGGTGRSLERIESALESTSQTNWASSRHPDGATPGRINSVTRKQFDALIRNAEVTPRFPVTGSAVTLAALIVNAGKQVLTIMSISLYLDLNKDSVLHAGELMNTIVINQLHGGDSTRISFPLENLPYGEHQLVISISAQYDEDTTNNYLFHSLPVGVPPSSIIITEIMYAPSGDLPEWIEAYNASSTPIDINGWTISDNGSARTIITHIPSHIPAHAYFIMTTDSLQFSGENPITTYIFEASFSSLNNTTSDAVVLRDHRGIIIDSVRYHPLWGGNNGNSLQRYDFFAPSADSVNWKPAQPTAGRENEIARKEIDVEVRRIEAVYNSNHSNIFVTLHNCGRTTIAAMNVQLYHDKDQDSIPSSDELLTSIDVSSLAPLDSTMASYSWTQHYSGRENIIAFVSHSIDQRMQNNIGFTSITRSYVPRTFVINEIMYAPSTGQTEFVELLNRSPDTVDIAEWTLKDQAGSSGSRTVILLASGSRKIAPGAFVIIASDSSIFTQYHIPSGISVMINPLLSLSNNGEDLVIVDLTETIIDSVRYSPAWHMKHFSADGRSLERIDPAGRTDDYRNWSSSVSNTGSTPGRHNSIFLGSAAVQSSLSLSPNPFSPDQDGFEDFMSIGYTIPAGSSSIRLRIYDGTGRLVRRLVQNEPSSSSGSVIWDGRDDDGNRVRIGVYIILFEALNHFGGTGASMKSVAVVGRKL